VDEVFAEVYKDNSFYRTSGGGVTIGGGEPTFQTGFTRALLGKLHDAGVHVAFDTCGYTVSDEAFALLTDADLLLFDLKGLDAEKHKLYTGVDNRIILDNLKRLDDMGKDIIIRLPMITGFTDDDSCIDAEIELIKGMKSVKRAEIIPYHDFARIKYEQLGREYPLDTDFLTDRRADEIKDRFIAAGIIAQIGG